MGAHVHAAGEEEDERVSYSFAHRMKGWNSEPGRRLHSLRQRFPCRLRCTTSWYKSVGDESEGSVYGADRWTLGGIPQLYHPWGLLIVL